MINGLDTALDTAHGEHGSANDNDSDNDIDNDSVFVTTLFFPLRVSAKARAPHVWNMVSTVSTLWVWN